MITKKIIIFIYKFIEHLFRHNFFLKQNRFSRSFRRRFNNYVYSKYSKKFMEFEGRKMYLDEGDSLHLSIRDYAPTYKEFVKKMIQKNSVVIDVGAHIGYFSLLFSELVGKNGHVFSFEPSSNFNILKKNIQINNFKNITPVNKAVSNETKISKLFVTSSLTTNHISNFDSKRSDFVKIETITLDEYFKNFNQNIDFLKCVSQGADFAVIQGMKNILKKMPDIKIMIAFSPPRLKEFGSDPKEFLETLENEGFFLYAIRSIHQINLTNSFELLKNYTVEKNNGTHLFCTRKKMDFKF